MAEIINQSTMFASGSSMTVNGSTFSVGLQTPSSQLKSAASLSGVSGVSVQGNIVFVTGNGAVLDGFDLRGKAVVVQASNVTIKNCLGSASGYFSIDQYEGYSGLTVENCTFDGQKADNNTGYIISSRSGSMTIRNNEFINVPSDAINTTGGTIEHNYFSGGGYASGAHADAISVQTTHSPLLIRENYIDFVARSDAAVPTNAAIKIAAHFGAVNDVTVEGNVLLGGGYTLYAGHAEHQASNIKILNNTIGRGTYGDLYPELRPRGFSFYGNQDFDSGTTLPNIGQAPVPTPAPTPLPAIVGDLAGEVTEAGGLDGNVAGEPTVTGTLSVLNASTSFVSQAEIAGRYGIFSIGATGQWIYTLDNANAAVNALNNGGTLQDSFTVSTLSGLSKVVRVTVAGTTDSSTAPDPLPGSGSVTIIDGTDEQDFSNGTDGSDIISLKSGVDVLQAGGGNDTISGGRDKDWLAGQGGDDVFAYTSILDSTTGSGRDIICDWGNGSDKIDLRALDANSGTAGTQGFTWIGSAGFSGKAGELRFFFDGENTVVEGNVNGDRAADFQIQLDGRHSLTAGHFFLPNVIRGTDAANSLTGTVAADVISGRLGADKIKAGSGGDVVCGGRDKDMIWGGAGNDRFVFNAVSESLKGTTQRDVIYDWGTAANGLGDDLIDLRKIDPSTATGDQAFKWIGTAGFSGKAGELRSYFDGTNTIVEGNTNTDRVADFQIQINGNHPLTALDFML